MIAGKYFYLFFKTFKRLKYSWCTILDKFRVYNIVTHIFHIELFLFFQDYTYTVVTAAASLGTS